MSTGVPNQPPLSIAVQAANLRSHFPFGTVSTSPSKLCWRGIIRHDETSRPYSVELIYKMGSSPDVFVKEPDLRALAGGRKLPHVYNEESQELCLYVPGCDFWTPKKLLSNTVMTWTCLWLRHFENWLITDVWHGHGIHPGQKN
jgi:hypothetical protein